MAAYRTLSRVTSLKEIDWLSDSWKYKYGDLPLSVSCLLEITKIQLLARKV